MPTYEAAAAYQPITVAQRGAFHPAPDSHDGNSNTSPSCRVESVASEFSRVLYVFTQSSLYFLLELCFQALLSMVQACNDLIISWNAVEPSADAWQPETPSAAPSISSA